MGREVSLLFPRGASDGIRKIEISCFVYLHLNTFNGHFSIKWHAKQDHYARHGKLSTLTHTGAGWTLRNLRMCTM
jgi:hypothetical protein